MNSLADAGTICLGGILLTGKLLRSDRTVFNQWNYRAFIILLVWCIGQNVFVEIFLYYDQLSVGKDLSWAPLAPTGPWINPVLFQFDDRTITLHGQIPWLLMTPILYRLTMYFQLKEIEQENRVLIQTFKDFSKQLTDCQFVYAGRSCQGLITLKTYKTYKAL